MKKLALALVSSAFAFAGATNANISTGFYLGIHGGYGATSGKETQQGLAGAPAALNTPSGYIDIGGNAGNIGIHGGYGLVSNCFYFGGEIAYTYEKTQLNDSLGQTPQTGAAILRRSGYFNAAFRTGYLIVPNVLAYLRLGINIGKWTLNDSLDAFNLANPGRSSKNRASFVPGLGLEVAILRNVYLRAEYTYEFGPGMRALNSNLPNNWLNISPLRTQTTKVGISYKF